MQTKNIRLFLLKLLVTTGGFYLVFNRVDFSQVLGIISGIRWGYLVAAIAMNFTNAFLSSLRLMGIAERRGSFFQFVRLTFIGSFFNLFLPTSIGGDVTKVVYYGKYLGSHSSALAVIFTDRFCGVTGLVLLETISLGCIWLFANATLPTELYFVWLLGVSAVVLCWLALYCSRLQLVLQHFLSLLPFSVVGGALLKVVDRVWGMRLCRSRVLVVAVFISLMCHFISSIQAMFVAMALQLSIKWYYFLAFVPLVNLILFIPVSISGLGVRDYLYQRLYNTVTSSVATSVVGVFSFLVLTVAGLVGACFYLFTVRTGYLKKLQK